jgi:hypothetical protein
VSPSTRSSPVRPSGRNSTPSVATSGVNEWPVPAARKVSRSSAAFRTAVDTSAVDRGVSTRAGVACTVRAQLRQPVVMRVPRRRPC